MVIRMENKNIRMKRLFGSQSQHTVINALDHGVTCGPMKGIENLEEILSIIGNSQSDAVILHKGNIRRLAGMLPKQIGIIMHLSASVNFSPYANTKVLVASVEEAVRMGADGVSIHVNLGQENDNLMLQDFGKVSEQCAYYGMPLLVMIYPKVEMQSASLQIRYIAHSIRVCEELGADIVKIPYVADESALKEILQYAHIPVVMAGGDCQKSEQDILKTVEAGMKNGLSGVSMGRNIFQNAQPDKLLDQLCEIVHKEP